MSRFYIFGLLFCLSLQLSAQSYFTAVGIRLGNSIGLTVNQRLQKKWSAEGILQNDLNGTISISALARKHTAIIARGLNLYAGVGPQLRLTEIEQTSLNPSSQGIDQDEDLSSYDFGVGLELIFGGEITLGRINVSLDAKPVIIPGESDFFQPQGAFSARYVLFKTSQAQKKRWRKKRKARKKKRRKRK